jgi:hypothetical protein
LTSVDIFLEFTPHQWPDFKASSKNVRFELFRERDVVEEYIRVLVSRVEAILELADTIEGAFQLRVAHEHHKRCICSWAWGESWPVLRALWWPWSPLVKVGRSRCRENVAEGTVAVVDGCEEMEYQLGDFEVRTELM